MTSVLDVRNIDVSKLTENPFLHKLDFRVVCSEQAYTSVLDHIRSNDEVEVCGVLVGDVYKDVNGPYLEITHAIRGEQASEKATEVTFTHSAWEHISSTMDTHFPDKKIVGWYHSHPRFGIFLSEPDMFIHGSFFNQPWQIALVVDQHSNEEGFFVWRDGTASPIDQYWIGNERRSYKPRASDNESTHAEQRTPAPAGPGNVSQRIMASLSVTFCLLGLLAFAGAALRSGAVRNTTGGRAAPGPTSVIPPSSSNPAPTTNGPLDIDVRQDLAARGLHLPAPAAVSQVGESLAVVGKAYTYGQRDLIAEMLGERPGVKFVDARRVLVTHQYSVRSKDSLTSIARRVYGNAADWPSIFDANRSHIRSSNMIIPTTSLYIPEAHGDGRRGRGNDYGR